MSEKILITGSSGFIGMHLCKNLLERGFKVFGIDNMNAYYSISLKEDRLKVLKKYENFNFINVDIDNYYSLNNIFKEFKPDKVVNLAAQAGVRYSLENPHAYIKSNIKGFMNILECCRHRGVKGLIYASSSSVYGGNKKTPFSELDRVDNPISIYAVTKKSNELMAKSYSHLYKLNTTGLRFFTVYGPWGRPDMAMYIFANKIYKRKELPVFNFGNMKRDFTYIDDIINGIVCAIKNNAQCDIFNLGNNTCEKLMDVISLIEKELNIKAKLNFMDIQPGDVTKTYANIDHAKKILSYTPKTQIEEGVPKFISWFKKYNNI